MYNRDTTRVIFEHVAADRLIIDFHLHWILHMIFSKSDPSTIRISGIKTQSSYHYLQQQMFLIAPRFLVPVISKIVIFAAQSISRKMIHKH